jgi:hypothetical protein
MITTIIRANANFLPFPCLFAYFNIYCVAKTHDSISSEKDALQNKKIYKEVKRAKFFFIAK